MASAANSGATKAKRAGSVAAFAPKVDCNSLMAAALVADVNDSAPAEAVSNKLAVMEA